MNREVRPKRKFQSITEIGDFVRVVPTHEDKFEEFVGRVKFVGKGCYLVQDGWVERGVLAGQCTLIEGR